MDIETHQICDCMMSRMRRLERIVYEVRLLLDAVDDNEMTSSDILNRVREAVSEAEPS